VSYVTLRRLSKKCKVAKKPHGLAIICMGDEKAPAIDGRGKLAEWIDVNIRPFLLCIT
jgi:hypothetical protein